MTTHVRVFDDRHVFTIQELTEASPASSHPSTTRIQLKAHQLTLLHRCKELEKGELSVTLQPHPAVPQSDNVTYRVKTDIGIIADKTGSGKSFVIMALVADSDSDSDARPSSSNMVLRTVTKSYAMDRISLTSEFYKRASGTSVLVIPHNLAAQWSQYVHLYDGDLKHVMLSKAKHFEGLTAAALHENKLVIVTTTFYARLAQLLKGINMQLKRVIFDEVDSMTMTSCEVLDSTFYWYVTASYLNLIYPRGYGRLDPVTQQYTILADGLRSSGCIKNLFQSVMPSSRSVLNTVIVKNNDAFVDASIRLPDSQIIVIRSKTPHSINILNGLVDRQIIQLLNADDVENAIRIINPTQRQSEENIVGILLDKYNRALHNLVTMRDYITLHMQFETDAQRDAELARQNKKITELEDKINTIKTRIRENNTCCICFDQITRKTFLSCCSNSFCFKCLNLWLSRSAVCPLCKSGVNMQSMLIVENQESALASSSHVAHVDGNNSNVLLNSDNYDKIQNLRHVLNEIETKHGRSKLLIFSSVDSIYEQIRTELNTMNRAYAQLKGTHMQISQVVDRYKNGDLDTLVINPKNYGSGLNLENTTDILMLHKFDSEVDKQVIGRAQRFGRTTPLRIWYLLYANEIPRHMESMRYTGL